MEGERRGGEGFGVKGREGGREGEREGEREKEREGGKERETN